MLGLRVDDLVERCNDCDGTGEVKLNSAGPAFPNWGTLNGIGGYCGTCKRTGGKLTSTGELLRDFILWLQRTSQIHDVQ